MDNQEIPAENKWAHGKIYLITCNDPDYVYVGSTAEQRLYDRWSSHKTVYNTQSNLLTGNGKYASTYALFDKGDCRIHLLEEYPCHSRAEIRAREQYYINLYGDRCVNRIAAFRSPEEKRERRRQAAHAHHIANREQINGQARELNKTRREKNNAYAAEYYAKNKAAIAAKLSQRITCECGLEIAKGGKSGHLKGSLHKHNMQLKADPNVDQAAVVAPKRRKRRRRKYAKKIIPPSADQIKTQIIEHVLTNTIMQAV